MMRSNIDAELRSDSARLIKTEITDEHLRELTSALAADVPADFTKRVMEEIRKERRSIALRHRLLRYGSAAIAALVIVPMAAIVVPAMIRGERNTDGAPSAQDTAVYDMVQENVGDILYSKMPVPEDNVDADAAANGIMTTSEVAAEAEAEAVPPSTPTAAPDHMSHPTENPAGMTGSTADTFAADTKYTVNVYLESPAITVLRSVIGTEKLDSWLAKEEIEENAAKEIIRAFAVQREDFLTAAAALNLSFTQDELNELFYTPLTNE